MHTNKNSSKKDQKLIKAIDNYNNYHKAGNETLRLETQSKAKIITKELQEKQSQLVEQDKKWCFVYINHFFATCHIFQQNKLKEEKFVIEFEKKLLDFNPFELDETLIKPGMTMTQLFTMYPESDLKILKFNSKIYNMYSQAIFQKLTTFDTEVERENLNQFYIEISDYCAINNIQDIKSLIRTINNTLLNDLQFRSQISFSNNRLLCKIINKLIDFSNDNKRKNGKLTPENETYNFFIPNTIKDINTFLYKINISLLKPDLISDNVYDILFQISLNDLGKILLNSDEILYLFPNNVKYILSLAYGIGDNDHTCTEIFPISISKMVSDKNEIFENIEGMSNHVSEIFRKNHYYFGAIRVKIIDSDNKKYIQKITVDRKHGSYEVIYENVKNLTNKLFENYPLIVPKKFEIELFKIVKEQIKPNLIPLKPEPVSNIKQKNEKANENLENKNTNKTNKKEVEPVENRTNKKEEEDENNKKQKKKKRKGISLENKKKEEESTEDLSENLNKKRNKTKEPKGKTKLKNVNPAEYKTSMMENFFIKK